jgi:hypothetical protein
VISIGCLIYRSPAHADFVYDSLYRHTPWLKEGLAEFYFVANGATDEVLDHLVECGFPHVRHNPPVIYDHQLKARGLAKPDYMTSVYSGCNRIFAEAKGEYCCMVSSDMAFSPGWLEGLMEAQDGTRIVTSQLIEPPKGANVAAGSIVQSFGENVDNFDEPGFLAFADGARVHGVRPKGQYVPVLIPMALWHANGGYPEGNVFSEASDYGTPGDRAMHERWERLGVSHVTAKSSVVYHFVEGEKRA